MDSTGSWNNLLGKHILLGEGCIDAALFHLYRSKCKSIGHKKAVPVSLERLKTKPNFILSLYYMIAGIDAANLNMHQVYTTAYIFQVGGGFPVGNNPIRDNNARNRCNCI